MVVICPKCKVRLKVVDEKISAEGTRFKCPRCTALLLVKKPAPQAKTLDKEKILVALEDKGVAERIQKILAAERYKVTTALDGIEAMVKSLKELPFLSLLGVSLPKIQGFEVCKRLKSRTETKDMKVILIASLYDKKRYHRDPDSFYGADGYLEDHQIEDMLITKIRDLKGVAREGPAGAGISADTISGENMRHIVTSTAEKRQVSEKKGDDEEKIEKARRLARTILSDIHLYSRSKVEEAIRKGTFREDFAPELREGTKLYQMRIPSEVRALGDFFNETVNKFIENKKRDIM
jgi:predicted Zn finger-like uncharacterized protein